MLEGPRQFRNALRNRTALNMCQASSNTYVILRTFRSSTFDKFDNLRYLPIYKQEKAQIIKSSLNSKYASQVASSSFKFVFCFWRRVVRLRGSGHLEGRQRLHLEACSSQEKLFLGCLTLKHKVCLNVQRQAVTYRNLRATRAEPLAQPRISQAEVHILDLQFQCVSQNNLTRSHKTWQQLTTGTLSTFGCSSLKVLYNNCGSSWLNSLKHKIGNKLVACNVQGRLSRSVNRDCPSVFQHFPISQLLPPCDSHAWLARIVMEPWGRGSDPPFPRTHLSINKADWSTVSCCTDSHSP